MTNAKTINSAIESANTLDELFEALDSYEDDSTRIDEVADLPGLPTFGGDEPADTAGIWSWDDDRLIVNDVNGGFVIETRAEYNV